ncbi:SEC-C domain-containing protein [uncultured Clostridium sp.]|jgi:hypothetical protein|uniref:SEC-C domain-containing protein n=1 Tax=uncultured Clostridium sp. TaxID=59620 RepID=UPI0025D6C589|nr:SEC-C domain-containing protein [uncultured Clostridium sp.]
MNKIKNRECFCGSGKKFKSCCMSKINSQKKIVSDEVLSNPNRLNQLLFERLKSTDYKTCFYPEKEKCKKPIKNAHTLQNNGILSLISENGHVRIYDLLNKVRKGTSTKEVSKNSATTFYGFCEYHDSVVFKEIELLPYTASEKQNFLHAYRTCAQEYHKKNRMLKAIQNCFKDNPIVVNIPGFIESYENMELSFKDVEKYMNIFNEAFKNNDFNILESYVYKFDQMYDFAVTTMFNPTFDINGKMLNDIYSKDEERLKSVFISILPTQTNSFFIISYLKEDFEHFKEYLEKIKAFTDDQLKIFLNNLIPTYSENIVLSPRLWDKWTPFSRREYEKVINGEIGDFSKLISLELPFDSLEDYIEGLMIKNGANDMMKKPKYDLFKKN